MPHGRATHAPDQRRVRTLRASHAAHGAVPGVLLHVLLVHRPAGSAAPPARQRLARKARRDPLRPLPVASDAGAGPLPELPRTGLARLGVPVADVRVVPPRRVRGAVDPLAAVTV